MTISGLANNAKKLVTIRILAFGCFRLNRAFVGRKELSENETKRQTINEIKNLTGLRVCDDSRKNISSDRVHPSIVDRDGYHDYSIAIGYLSNYDERN